MRFKRIPPLAEQRRIAACLSALDEMLAATNGKLEQLKAYKKGLMQQLFANPRCKPVIINGLQIPAVKVNTEKLLFNYLLGRDIVEMHVEERWGESVIMQLSQDLKTEMPGIEGLSKSNIYYCKKFYLLYRQYFEIFQQAVGKLETSAVFRIPWRHHCLIMDKVKNDTDKAMFFVNKSLENGWSSTMLLNWIDTELYEREGKALTNFTSTLPAPDSDLAQEVAKDPYNFAFAGVRGKYNESLLKQALLGNITDFLIELGTGFAYVGREYRLQIGETENFIDLLFYHLQLRCYVVVEVKTDKFSPRDIGQLGTYVVACNHLIKRPRRQPHNRPFDMQIERQYNSTICPRRQHTAYWHFGIRTRKALSQKG